MVTSLGQVKNFEISSLPQTQSANPLCIMGPARFWNFTKSPERLGSSGVVISVSLQFQGL